MDTLPPAGWYPDPDDPRRQRWWDGAAWAAPVPSTPPAPVAAPARRPAAPSAIASLVLSLLWLGGVGSIAGIVLGMRARREIRTSAGRQGGEGLAVAGLVIGVLGLLGALLLAGLTVFAVTWFRSVGGIDGHPLVRAELVLVQDAQAAYHDDLGRYAGLADQLVPYGYVPFPGIDVTVVVAGERTFCAEASNGASRMHVGPTGAPEVGGC